MSTVELPLDASLEDWARVDNTLTSNGLLVGNGASRVIWDKFSYDSLFDRAKTLPTGERLTPSDEASFSALNTQNFEMVLFSLMTADKVMSALAKPDPDIMVHYERIRNALVKAVHSVHIEHVQVPTATLTTIGEELNRYDFVYSTNYDLIMYWSMVEYGLGNFKDFFFGSGPCFDPAQTNVWGKVTKVLFIHGGLHLYLGASGESCKLTAGTGTILSNFAASNTIPLFISEGDARDKLSAIYRSDYLSFAYSCLAQHSGPLVVFGQSLGDPDKHLVDAINRAKVATLVIGVYPSSATDVVNAKAHYKKCFPNSTLQFFDSTTHPIGARALRVTP